MNFECRRILSTPMTYILSSASRPVILERCISSVTWLPVKVLRVPLRSILGASSKVGDIAHHRYLALMTLQAHVLPCLIKSYGSIAMPAQADLSLK